MYYIVEYSTYSDACAVALWKGGPVRADLGKVPERGGRNMNGHLERIACQL